MDDSTKEMLEAFSPMFGAAMNQRMMEIGMEAYDRFAREAMSLLMTFDGAEPDRVAFLAWAYADKMMEERKKRFK